MFGQLAGRSVFNTPTGFAHFCPMFAVYYLKKRRRYADGPLLPCTPFFCGRGSRDVGRTRFGNRARVVGLARSPTMRTPSPTTKLLAGMLASKAGGRRVIYQKYTLNKKNTYGGALRPRPALPRQSSASP